MKKEKLIEYSSNNSGGSWWLKDKDWKNLEKAGWKIVYEDQEYVYEKGNYAFDSKGFPKLTRREKNGNRWLGALSTTAFKFFPSVKDAISEWEEITGQNAEDEGCDCCGQPHNFSVV